MLPALACAAVTGIGLLLPRLIGHEQALLDEGPGARPPRLRAARADALLQQQPPGDPERHLLGAGHPPGARDLAIHPGRAAASAPAEHPAAAARALVDAGHLGAALCRGLCGAVPAVPSRPLHLSTAALLVRRHRRGLAADLRVAWPPAAARSGLVADPLGLAISLAAAYLAVRVVPLGPQLSSARLRFFLDHGARPVVVVAIVVAVVAGALVWRRGDTAPVVVAVAAVLAGTLLLAEVAIAGRGVSPAGAGVSIPRFCTTLARCPRTPSSRAIRPRSVA